MKCPRCKTTELTQTLYEGVTLDSCPSCEGEWLDKGEVSAIIDAREVVFTKDEIGKVRGVKENVEVFMGQPSDPLMCPHCNCAMKRINYGYSTGVIIDRCPQCEGLWLDKDELEHIQIIMEDVEKNLPEVQKKISPVLEKVKAKQKLKQEKQMKKALGEKGAKSPLLRGLYKFLTVHM